MNCNDKLVVLLASKKRTLITENGIFLIKGKSPKNAIIKLKGYIVPDGINIKNYNAMFVKEESVENIPFYD